MRQNFFEAFTTDRIIGSGQITINYYDELVKIWGVCPASKPLSYGISTTYVIDNINADNFFDDPSNSRSNSLSNSA